jgi:hypothetical protein
MSFRLIEAERAQHRVSLLWGVLAYRCQVLRAVASRKPGKMRKGVASA